METRTAKTADPSAGAEKDYGEENPRPREEFAREFIKAYGGALKKIMCGESPGRPVDESLKEAFEFIEEEKKNGRY